MTIRGPHFSPPRKPDDQVQLYSWQWFYNLNLIGKDRLPAGVQPGEAVYDLAPSQRVPDQVQLRTWTYNGTIRLPTTIPPDLTKIFRGHLRSLPDQPYPPNAFQSWTQSFFIPRLPLPYGEQVTDLPQRPPEQIQLHSWTQSFFIPRLPLPYGEQVTDLPQRPPEQIQLHSWTAFYNLNLIGKDRLPTGEQIYDLSPSQRTPEQIQLHSWTWNYNLNLIGQDRMIVGKQVYDLTLSQRLPVIDQTWAYDQTIRSPVPVTGPLGVVANQYNWPVPQAPSLPGQTWIQSLNLAAQGFNPATAIWGSLPAPAVQFQTWTYNQTIRFPAPPAGPLGVVANKYDWPLPQAALQPQFWQQPYNSNLQAVPPDLTKIFRGHLRSLPDQPATPLLQQSVFRAWPTLYAVTIPPGPPGVLAAQYDWPVPRDYQRQFQIWAQNVSLALTNPPTVKQLDWPLPRGYEPDWRRSWEAHYNLNLIGKDALPPGQRIYDLTPPDFQRQFQTWIANVSLALTTSQTFAPATAIWGWLPALQQPAQSFTASYNLNLIGQDKLPPGQQITDALPPRDISRALQTWIANVSLALVVPPIIGPLGIVANQYDWPNPRGPQPLTSDWPQQNLTIKLPPPPAVTELHQNPFFTTMGRLSQLGNLPS